MPGIRGLGGTAERIRVKRHEFPDAHRRPAGHPHHAVCHPIIPTRAVQLGHRHQMPGQVLSQPHPLQLPFPILRGDVRVPDLSVRRVRVLPGDPVHVLRLRTGEFVDPAQVRPTVREDGSDYASDISRSNWRSLAPPERQFDTAAVADARTGEGEEEAFREGWQAFKPPKAKGLPTAIRISLSIIRSPAAP
jgi:hypothetical protein